MPIFNTYIGDEEVRQSEPSVQDAEDQRLRRNIRWGVVQGMFLYLLFMIPIALILGMIIEAFK